MPIGVGSQLGSHEILSAIGRGGMGEVWRARDSKLGRDVAIKTLPAEFAREEDRLARFEREARLLASLNHPNIAAIYGIEEFAGTRFIVLELVEGETLAEILKRGPVAPEEALRLALQIAAAVEAAHEKGVVHRDLKPGNIMITPDGTVKVLDFGLAKALQGDERDLSNSPTLSMAATAQGIILGTAAYMSPEQARGKTVDNRTDVWAFGCVLYEMLTGRQAFRGEQAQDILASVLARDPDFSLIHAELHPRLEEIVQRCLEKDPRRRWQAIGDVRMEIERLVATGGARATAAVIVSHPKAPLRVLLPWVAGALLVGAVATWLLKPSPVPDRPLARFEYVLPENQVFRNTGRQVIAFAPDGRHFVYNTARGLFIRSMDSLTARVIPGTEDPAANPFFSPNGEWVGYYHVPSGELRKITIAGGAPVTLGPAMTPLGASWGLDGNILFAQPAGIMRVSADGGTPELVIKLKPGEAAHGPSLLPDGKTILYTLTRAQGQTRWDQAEIVAQTPGDAEPKVLLRGGGDALYAPTGHLTYAVGNALFAVPFDANKLEVKGGPVPIVQGVQRATIPGTNSGSANYGFSNLGTLVYVNAVGPAVVSQSTLAIVDRNGAVRRLELPPANYRSPRVSPEGRQLAVETITESGQSIIWVYDLSGKTAIRRLTQEGSNTRPVWTSDSKSITYGSDREKTHGIFVQPADGSGLPQRLTTARESTVHIPESWSPDGRILAFAEAATLNSTNSWSLWTLAKDSSEKKPTLFYDSEGSNEFGSVFSPDGKWVAYASNEGSDGQFGIYVQPYPPTGVKYEISRTGGAWPVWSPTGGELFYRLNVGDNNAAKMKALTITTKPVPAFTSDKDVPIQGFLPVVFYREYDLLPNGREFVMVFPIADTTVAAPPSLRIHIVLNWFEELKARIRTP